MGSHIKLTYITFGRAVKPADIVQEIGHCGHTLVTRTKNKRHLMRAIGPDTHAQHVMQQRPSLIDMHALFDHVRIFSPA